MLRTTLIRGGGMRGREEELYELKYNMYKTTIHLFPKTLKNFFSTTIRTFTVLDHLQSQDIIVPRQPEKVNFLSTTNF